MGISVSTEIPGLLAKYEYGLKSVSAGKCESQTTRSGWRTPANTFGL
jgi:hypothetical protein